MRALMRFSWNSLVIAVLALAVMAGRGQVERTGDYLQIALPATAFACSVANGEGVSNFARFIGTQAIVHSSKRGLGDAEINQRPRGGQHGFPSGHTTAAAFGVSSLLNSCVKKNPWVQGAIILSGGYVGASRIEVGAHFLFQVLVGALLGWLGERSVWIFRASRLAYRNRSGLLLRVRLQR